MRSFQPLKLFSTQKSGTFLARNETSIEKLQQLPTDFTDLAHQAQCFCTKGLDNILTQNFQDQNFSSPERQFKLVALG